MKWYDYGYLEEIKVQREDEILHKFKKSDFLNLNLHDIEDMLLLLVQKKISNLSKDVIFDLNVALRMFTRRNSFHDIASNLRMEYLPKRRWNERDRSRSRIMIKKIDKQLYKRRLMRNLEKFVGGREYGEDLRLLERTNRRDLPMDIPLFRIEVFRYDKRRKTKKKRIVPTEMELVLKQTQQDSHGPSDAHAQPSPATQGLSTDSCFISHGDYTHFYRLSHSELVGHQSDTYVFTMKMENTSVFNLITNDWVDAPVMRTTSAAAKPCQEDSLKFYLITFSIYTESKGTLVFLMVAAASRGRVRSIATCSYPTDILLKLKNFKKDEFTSFQDKERYEHVGPKVTSTQDGKRSQVDDKRLCLVDDLKKIKITASQA
ncbi:hypothetical protein Tco_1047996 [Tanacetum coccineum]